MATSLFCSAMVALGTSLFGLCAQDALERAPSLPEEDQGVWSFRPVPPPPPPPEPAPEPAPPPPMPPVVIEKTVEVIREVPAPAPEPVVIKWPEPVIPEPVVRPSGAGLAAVQALASRRAAPRLSLIEAPARGRSAAGVAGGKKERGAPALPALQAPAGGSVAIAPPELPEGTYEADGARSTFPVDNRRILTADRYITGVLETGINSQVGSSGGGEVIVQTSRDVYGYHGRLVLIPKGSRLICGYSAPDKAGVTRLAMSCSRILLGGTRAEIWQASGRLGDVQGRAGVTGRVDQRFWQRYGTAFLMTAISAGLQVGGAVAKGTGDNQGLAEAAADELSKRFGEITGKVLESKLDLTPVITISQGTRVQIRPGVDWYIRQLPEGRRAQPQQETG